MSRVIHIIATFLIALSILCTSLRATADNNNEHIDSLKALLEQADIHDTVRINAMTEICSTLKSKDPEAALSYGKNAINMAKNLNLDSQRAGAHNIVGVVYWQMSELGLAMDHLHEARNIHKKHNNEVGIAITLTNIGLIYSDQSHYEKALEYYFKALGIFKDNEHQQGIAATLNNIGSIYEKSGNWALSEWNHRQSLEIKKKLNDQKGMAFSYNNLGIVKQNQEQFDKALQYFQKALEIRKNLGDIREKASTLSRIGSLKIVQEDYSSALDNLYKALKLFKEVNDQRGISQTLNYLGQAHIGIDDLSKAEKYFYRSIDIAQNIDISRITNQNYYNLAKLYAGKNDYHNAYNYQQKYLYLKDSIFSEVSRRRIYEFQMLFERERKEKELELYRKASHINALNYEKQRLLKNFLLAGVIIVIILLFLLYNRYLVINKTNKLLEKRKEEISQSNEKLINLNKILFEQKKKVDDLNQKLHQTNQKLIESEKHLIEVNAAKDKFFSIISHDLRNPFASIVSFSRMLKRDIENLSREELKNLTLELDKTVAIINDLLENLLQWSRSHTGKIKYDPQYLDMAEIVDDNINLFSTKAKIKEISIDNGINSNLIVWADYNMTDTVIRNLLSNAIKFTKEKGKVQLYYKTDKDYAYISVKDNGVGISKEVQEKVFCSETLLSTAGTHDEKGSGIGLLLCKEFVEKQYGKIEFESKEKGGSIFTFSLPLNGTA